MNILDLDLATITGWATNMGARLSGTMEFKLKRGESPGMRFLRCRAWLAEMFELMAGNIDVIVYEQAHHRGGAATSVCVGLVTEVLAFAADRGIEAGFLEDVDGLDDVVVANTGTWHAGLLGRTTVMREYNVS